VVLLSFVTGETDHTQPSQGTPAPPSWPAEPARQTGPKKFI